MFKDRKDAALQLARALEKFKDTHAVVLGIPRGGVVTGYYVADFLHADFSMVVARKLGHPSNPEYAVGAIAEDGSFYLNKEAEGSMTDDQMKLAIAREKKEIERRILLLRNGAPLPPLEGRTVIIVDDGIATGATVIAAARMCRKMKAARIIVAAPVSGERMIPVLEDEADEVVVLEVPEYYRSVSQVYQSFTQVSDEEAMELLRRS